LVIKIKLLSISKETQIPIGTQKELIVCLQHFDKLMMSIGVITKVLFVV
jgi:prefoldin subunit 5